MLSNFAAGFVDFEINKYQIVFVNEVLQIEEYGCYQWYERHETWKEQAVEQYDQRVALMVPEIELIVIFELCFYDRVFLLSFMQSFWNINMCTMNQINEPESIRDKSQLNYELNVKELLGHELLCNLSRQRHQVFFNLIEMSILKVVSQLSTTYWYKKQVNEQKELDFSHDTYLFTRLPSIIFKFYEQIY